jgi:serine/threonine protein kinase/Flp pilus assembly protein TadD
MSEAFTTENASAEALMGELVDEFVERLARGEQPEVEEYARRHPQLAAALRQLLPALRVVHLSTAERPPPAEPLAPEIKPEGALGDFRIVREIGRGGMGVVYQAVQISLGRRVALKVLPFAAGLDARQLQRFKNEAEAAAHLHHQHIVPVYAVGSERGVHYYAMQFIDGHTLAALIQELRRLAGREDRGSRISEDRGSKLEEADTLENRARGTDTRPAEAPSSILDPRSSILNPRSSFFRTVAGLAVQAAEALEHAHSLGVIHRDIKPANLLVDGRGNLWVTDFGLAHVQADARLTRTGDLVGTLRYMSPEQALAQPAGVDHRTDLYSLGATLYELLTLEPAFDGCDRQELLRQIAFDEPIPLRRINRAVPADLETIVLKAMAKDPAERYATAAELAEDLGRFLKDEPIRARRPTLLRRARKWARRHRPVVWSAAVAALVALTVLAGSAGWVMRDRAALQARTATEVQAALDEAQRCQREAQWLHALAAARRAEALLASGGGSEEFRESVRALRADLRLVVKLEGIRLLQAEVDVKEDRFVLENTLPEYRRAFGDYGWRADALAPEEAAARLRRRPAAVRGPLVAALDHWLILARYKKAPEADWLKRVLNAVDSDPWRRRLRAARGRNALAALEQLAREVDAAAQPPETLFILDRALRQRGAREGAVALLRRAQEAFPGDFWINHNLGMALRDGRPPQSEEAIRFLTAAVALRPQSAGARLNLGVAFFNAGRLDEAIGAFRQAIAQKPDYAMAHNNLGVALSRKSQTDEAVAAWRRAIELKPDLTLAHRNLAFALLDKGHLDEAATVWRRVVALNPDQAGAHCDLGFVLWKQGRLDEALAAFRQAIRLKPDFALAHSNLGNVLLARGRLDEAIASCRRAIALEPGYAEAHYILGVALGKKGRFDEAAAAHRRAIELKPDHAEAHCDLGCLLWKKGRLDEAAAAFRKAVALKPDFADAHYNLGNIFVARGRLGEAVAAYRRALKRDPNMPEAHCNLGQALRQQGDFAPALAALKRGHEVGSRRPDWPYPSAQWVRECQRLSDQLRACRQLWAEVRTLLARAAG